MRVELIKITPVVAKSILESQSFQNRVCRKLVVEEYKRQMDSGDFTLNDSMICFDSDNNLLNGWHRLTACSMSCNGFSAYVCYGMPTENVKNMDAHAKRSVADRLLFSVGRRMSDNEASIITLLVSIKTTVDTRNIRLLESCFGHYKNIIDKVKTFQNYSLTTSVTVASLIIAIDNNLISLDRSASFFKHMDIPDSIHDSAAVVWRMHYDKNHIKHRGLHERKKLMIIAYNCILSYSNGKNIKRIPTFLAQPKLSWDM